MTPTTARVVSLCDRQLDDLLTWSARELMAAKIWCGVQAHLSLTRPLGSLTDEEDQYEADRAVEAFSARITKVLALRRADQEGQEVKR